MKQTKTQKLCSEYLGEDVRRWLVKQRDMAYTYEELRHRLRARTDILVSLSCAREWEREGRKL